MILRKNYLINKKFQFKTTFTVIGITVLLLSVLLAVMSSGLFQVNKKIDNILKIEKEIVGALTVPPPNISVEEQKFILQMARSHNKNLKSMSDMITLNKTLIIIIIAAIVLQGLVVFIILILQTHRIAGPIFVMSKYIKDITNGKIPKKLRPLRKNDHFKDFYKDFEEMVKSLEKKK